MAGAITATAKGTNNINTSLVVRDVSSTIHLLKPAETPLMTLLKSKSGNSTGTATKIEWIEDSLQSRWMTLNAGIDNAVTSMVLTAGGGALASINDLLINTTTNEIVLITNIVGDTLTVTRGYGDVAKKAAMTTAHKLLNIGNVNMQGAGAPAERSNNPTMNYNYMQIFRKAFSVTNTLNAINLYGDQSELERLHMKKGIEHAVDIEMALWNGHRNMDLTGAQPMGALGGVRQFLEGTNNVFSKASGSLVEADLDTYMEAWFKYGSSTKVAICGPTFINWIHNLAKAKMNLIQADQDKKYGLNMTTLVSPYGELKIVRHPLFTDGLANRTYVLDMETIDYVALRGRDTKLKENIQNNDEDGRRDEYLTECTLRMVNPEKNGGLIIT
jgi:hypothetical protein